MANRAEKSGLSKDIQSKLNAKYSVESEQQCRQWIEAVIGEPLSNQEVGMHQFQECLKDGQVLCKLINSLKGSKVVNFNTMKQPFKQMENIEKFLTACTEFGLKDGDKFQTADLFDCQNMSQVLTTLYALSSVALKKNWDGPSIGVKIAQENKREFTKEQLDQSKSVIGLQMGTNKGASQAGMNIGKTRAIMD